MTLREVNEYVTTFDRAVEAGWRILGVSDG